MSLSVLQILPYFQQMKPEGKKKKSEFYIELKNSIDRDSTTFSRYPKLRQIKAEKEHI